MALIKCYECGHEISDQAQSCPNCGAVNRYMQQQPSTSKKKSNKGNVCMWISMIISAMYIGFSIPYWVDTSSAGGDMITSFAGAAASMIVFPHLVAACVATIFNIASAITHKSGYALASAILYTISMILFPMYWTFVVIQTVLMYIAYARMKLE